MDGQRGNPVETLAYARAVPVAHAVDVLVVGGGTSGVAAAVAAARQGVPTMLVERYGFVGGTAVGAPVPIFQEGPRVRGEAVIRGIYAEQKARLARYDGLHGEPSGIELESAGIKGRGNKVRSGYFDPAMMQLVCLEMCQESGVRLLLHTYLVDVVVVDGTVRHAICANKGGLVAVAAKQFIDATADGDLAAAAGASAQIGRPGDGLTQPATLPFYLANIDFEKLNTADWNALWTLFAAEVPEASVARGRIGFQRMEEQGRLRFGAATHVPHANAADPADRSRMEVMGRLQAKAVMEFFRRHVPGCERCIVADMGVEVGIRESRRIMADYVITRDDVLEARKFPDSVGCSTSWIDVHEPHGLGVRHEYLPRDDWFELPYRALVTAGLSNLYTVGRAVSCTHEALGALRTIPTGIMIGESAGVAAALCARAGVQARGLEVGEIQRALVEAGVFIGSAQGAAIPLPRAR